MADGNCGMGLQGPCLMCEWMRFESIGLHEQDGGGGGGGGGGGV